MAATAQSVFRADIEVAFDDGEYTEIEPSRIQYLMIDYRFENINILPILYLSLKIPLDLHDRILDGYETAKFYLVIDKKDGSIESALATRHIAGEFSYVCSNKEQNSAKNLNINGTDDRSYVTTDIGLVSNELMSSLRSFFNAIYVDMTVEQLVNSVALGNLHHMTIVETPIIYSDIIDRFIVYPTTSRYKILELIFEMYPFYDTYYTFFMDFGNVCYLLDKSGNPISADGYSDTIYFDITMKDDPESIFPGSRFQKGSDHIKVNASQTKMNVNESVGQIVNTVAAFDYDTGVQYLTISDNFTDGEDKKIFMKSNNAAVYKNEVVNSTVVVEMYKQSIDSGLLTPNREYIITQPEGTNYQKYDGRYILAYKQEVYAQNGSGGFNMTCTAGFKRIDHIEVAGAIIDTAKSSRHKGIIGTQKSSADKAGKISTTKITTKDKVKSNTTGTSSGKSAFINARKTT